MWAVNLKTKQNKQTIETLDEAKEAEIIVHY